MWMVFDLNVMSLNPELHGFLVQIKFEAQSIIKLVLNKLVINMNPNPKNLWTLYLNKYILTIITVSTEVKFERFITHFQNF